jgi:Zn finger protein HypA/HybF involved in hydrogenase expression
MTEEQTEKYIAYCVKCKAKKEMKDPQIIEMKGKGGTKRRAVTGTCPDCGTKMFRILGKA